MTKPGAGGNGPPEVTGLGSAREYAAGMVQAFTRAATGTQTFAAGLGGHGVDGPAVTAVARAQELTSAAAAAWEQASGALDQQTVVQEAYAVTPEAGDKQFLTDGTNGPGGPADTTAPGVGDPPGVAALTGAACPSSEQVAAEDAVLEAWSKLRVVDTSEEALRIRAEADAIRLRRRPAPESNPYTGTIKLDDLNLNPDETLTEEAQHLRWTAEMFDSNVRRGDRRAADDALFWHAAADAVEAAAAVEPPASRAPGPGTDQAEFDRWRRDEMVLARAQDLYGDEGTEEAAQLQRDADAIIRRRRLAHRAAVKAGVTPCVASRGRDVPCVHPDGDHHEGLCFAADGTSWPRHTSWAAPETWEVAGSVS